MAEFEFRGCGWLNFYHYSRICGGRGGRELEFAVEITSDVEMKSGRMEGKEGCNQTFSIFLPWGNRQGFSVAITIEYKTALLKIVLY